MKITESVFENISPKDVPARVLFWAATKDIVSIVSVTTGGFLFNFGEIAV